MEAQKAAQRDAWARRKRESREKVIKRKNERDGNVIITLDPVEEFQESSIPEKVHLKLQNS